MTLEEKKDKCLRCIHCIYYAETRQIFCEDANKYIVFCDNGWKFQEKVLNSNQKVIYAIV